MQKSKFRIFNIIKILMGLVLALTPFVLFPVCDGLMKGMPMKCYYSGIFMTVAGAVIVLFSVIGLFVNKKWYSYLSNTVVIVEGALSYLVPHQVIKIGNKAKLGWECGMCNAAKMGERIMTCQTKTVPATNIIIPIIIVLGIVGIIYSFLRNEG